MMKETRFTPINLLILMMAFVGFAPVSFAQTETTPLAAEKSMEVKISTSLPALSLPMRMTR